VILNALLPILAQHSHTAAQQKIRTMNRIVTLSIIFFLGMTGAKAQNIDYENSGKWFLGLNVGGTWQTTDIKNQTNVGYGVVLGKSFNYNYGKRLVFDLRARYLHGEWYGKDADSTTIDLDTAGLNSFYGLNNFLSTQNRLALELVIHANRIRERTGFDPYIFGGIGLTWASTYADYYNKLDSTESFGMDGIYETELTAVNKVSIMPSLGFGLGYQIGKRATIGIEHKTTFTGYDLYDGLQSPIRIGNDLHHYTSFFVNFRFRSHTNSSGGTTNTGGGGTNGSGNINNYNTSQGCISPVVTYSQPAGNATSANQTTHVSAIITNTIDRNNIIFKINGVASTNFTYTSQTNRFDADILLQQGTNTIEITATNTCGSDVEVTTVNYQPCLSPIVLFTDPVTSNLSVSSTSYTIQADIYHVTDRNNIAFTVNGIANNMFSFNPQTGKFTATINLVENNNVIQLSALTACGQDGKNTTIIRKTCQMPVIAMTAPTASGITVRTANLPLSFKTQHVAAKPNVSISVNGQTVSSYTFNASSGVGTANVVLIPGVNTIVVTSSNGCGTDTETITVNYDNCVPPTVSITNPTMNNATFTNPQISLVAVTQNITSTQGVSITVNNQSISNFTLNTANGQIQSGITLNPGLNVIAVTVVNGCGTDIKTINVNYKACTPPSIQITNPVMNGSTVNTPVFAITGSFQNITSAQNVTLQQNGRAISGLSFNAQTGLFTANVNLNNGANSFTISVVNECGTASETILINYTAPVNNTPQMITICHYPPGNNGNPQTIEIPLSAWPAHQAHGDVLGPCPVVNPTPPCNPPAILVTNPTQNGQTVQQTSYTITASISNIANNQGINYVVNGKPITNFSLSNGVFSNTVNLVNGWNTFIITATNGCGSVTETITINYSSPVDNTPQMITICHYPPGNNGNPQTLEIPLASWPAHQAHGDVLGPCPVVNTPPCNPPSIQVTNPAQNNQTVQQPAFTVTANISNVANNQGISCLFNGMPMSSFVFANGEFSANVNLIPGTNNIVLTAVNTCGTDTETIAVNYSAPVDNTPQKVTICHYPPGNSGNPQTIEIPLSAWPAHQAHGDVLGPCPVVNTPPCNPPSIQVTNPTQSGQTVQQTSFNITANISNIANNQGIVYTVNGKPITSFSFSNGSFSNTVNLNAGINTFTITATNGCGTDTETITINYSAPAPQTMTICHQGNRTQETMVIPVSDWPMHQAHGDIMGACPQVAPTPPCNPPTIQVTNPTQSGQTVQQASFNITANISNIANSQGIIYTVNGKPMTSFSFSNGSFSNSVNLNVGINTFTITATNNCGTDTETITINYSAPTPPCNPPSIQVTNPTQNGIRVQSANFVFGATISNISNNQGVVMLLNGKPFVGFAFAPTKGGSLTSSLTLNPGTNMIVVTATNECGTDTETITINYVEPVEQKVVICHKSGNTTQTLEIPMSAWPAHQAHGDVLGPCPTQKPNENGGQQQNNGSGNEQPVKPEIKPATRGGNGETEAEPKEEENKEINKPGEGKVQGKGRG
jgi:PKD repeat protein